MDLSIPVLLYVEFYAIITILIVTIISMEIKVNVDRVSSGLYILFFGFIFLWISVGFIKWNMLFQLLRLWPLLFVIVGLDLILRRTRFNILRIATPFIVMGVTLTLINVAQDGNIFQPRIIEKQKISRENLLPGKSTDLSLDFYSGKLKIGEGDGELLKADISMPKGEEPNLVHKSFEKEDLYQISDSNVSNYIFSPWDGDHIWDFRLNKEVPFKLNAKTYASMNEMDLSKLSVADFNLDTNFSSSRIIVAPKSARLTINANSSYLTLEIPKKIGVKIKLEKTFIIDNFAELGLTQGFKEYASANYGESEKKVDIYLNLKLSQIEIRFY